jgi:hypothetical protein
MQNNPLGSIGPKRQKMPRPALTARTKQVRRQRLVRLVQVQE